MSSFPPSKIKGSQNESTKTYECTCGAFWPVKYLLYCVTCKKPRCPTCVVEELVGKLYCEVCLDDTIIDTENADCCEKCRLCPLCKTLLLKESTSDDLCCPSCNWSTKQSDMLVYELKSLTLDQELALVPQKGQIVPIPKQLVCCRSFRCPVDNVLLYRDELSFNAKPTVYSHYDPRIHVNDA